MSQFIFSRENIEINRMGRMSTAQAKTLSRSLGHYEGTLIFWIALLIPFVLAILFTPKPDWIVLCLFSVLVFGGVVVLMWFQWTLWRDAQDGVVSEIAGKVWVVSLGGIGKTHSEIHIEDHDGRNWTIKARKQEVQCFKSGSCYRIFHAPRSQILLSAEETKC